MKKLKCCFFFLFFFFKNILFQIVKFINCKKLEIIKHHTTHERMGKYIAVRQNGNQGGTNFWDRYACGE